ncbi:ABC-2 type transport system permease protein [Actinoplanes campanulatus]|uniref:Transport permease protein n=1 Tax=Actinoplanes campanulatus TaxID=113559 RepID=A0A7W5AKW4_9ACTN|nr:ABC transporter permease [Actinoplanes campanulatus]MBB3097986.1 ABC-2 type transport system permease protein [Actinoplanes campanulatus]GGN31742.1 transport permease protein [Actinoplanes campanulatus]GID41374.1 transport permease protein [Actinoplanes campanulatus]
MTDGLIMLRRQFRHMARDLSTTLLLLAVPIIFLLLFVYVLGGTLGDGLGGQGGRQAYVNYVVPGILLITVASAVQGTSIAVAIDMTSGIMDRFRTMAIARTSVLTGHVLGSVLQILCQLLIILAVAVLVGFRPDATVTEWLATAALLTATAFALVWLAVGMGLSAKSVNGASNLPMPLTLLPLFGSGFVPTESMPAGLSWFAEHQPFTPIMETLRGLLLGTPIGNSGAVAAGWCGAIAVAGYVWARRNYGRERSA